MRHTRCALVTGVQTCALPICRAPGLDSPPRSGPQLPGQERGAQYEDVALRSLRHTIFRSRILDCLATAPGNFGERLTPTFSSASIAATPQSPRLLAGRTRAPPPPSGQLDEQANYTHPPIP